MTRTCPFPYADSDDQVEIPCSEARTQRVTRGLVYSHEQLNLLPYTNYKFELQAFNKAGGLSDPPSVVATTLPAGIPELM